MTNLPEASKREERAHRILDAAATLILRYGYNKTTLDDVARVAGVAKGTLYLHWKSREELFGALMIREKAALTEDFRQRIAADPEGPTLRSIMRHSALALLKRPLLKAELVRDLDVIGKLALGAFGGGAYVEKIAFFQSYLELLREHGLIRSDLPMKAQVYAMSAIFMGFFLVEPLMPDELKLADEQLADLLAETVHRTLEIAAPDQVRSASGAFMHYVDRSAAQVQTQLRQAMDPHSAQKEANNQ